MKYENAGDILPQSLLTELQKYASGKLLYIPSGDNKRLGGKQLAIGISFKREIK